MIVQVTFSVHYEEHSPDASNEITRETVIRDIADLVPDDYKACTHVEEASATNEACSMAVEASI